MPAEPKQELFGPSPRGWGILNARRTQAGIVRTIPTRVGNTVSPGGTSILIADHPHAGGEYSTIASTSRPMRGPSPRGWGIRMEQQYRVAHERTIPTRVGNTVPSHHYSNSSADHPHAGGEYWTNGAVLITNTGPSPRGWGIPDRQLSEHRTARTIPTRVGNTVSSQIFIEPSTDHPHAGGEYLHSQRELERLAGPSPRGWGILDAVYMSGSGSRTIPTRVGNTRHDIVAPCCNPDHPHAGGEYALEWMTEWHEVGPSPRGWGILSAFNPTNNNMRTIPTRVGNTSCTRGRSSGHPDHPHAGGEYSVAVHVPIADSGPSPRGWGIRRGRAVRGLAMWTIPTRVGNTHGSTAFNDS